MSKKNCDLVKDLLPLYADGICSEESRKTVAEHIALCDSCRSELTKMQTEINISEKADEDISIIKKIRRKIIIERIIAVIASVIVFFIIAVPVTITGVNGYEALDYEKNNLEKNVYVEEDESGKVWLVRKGVAYDAMVDFGMRDAGTEGRCGGLLNTKKTLNGQLTDAENIDFVVTLAERKYEHFMDKLNLLFRIDADSVYMTNRTLITDLNDNTAKKKITGIYYYDTETDNEYVLWERK